MSISDTLKQHKGAMTVQELAPIIGVSAPHLYDMAREGLIPSYKLGQKAVRFDPAKVSAWLQKRENNKSRSVQ
jgi:excisionase family DNA binding protein